MHQLLFAIVALFSFSAAASDGYMQRPAVRQFVDEMAAKHDFNSVDLIDLLSQAVRQEKILDAIRKPSEAKPWHQYRELFLTTERIGDGVRFWNENHALLERAEEKFGVPPEIIMGILGVETRFGQQQGRYRVLDALMTLGFDYPERGEFFRKELEEFLLLTREEHLDPLTLMGSYAGAIGQAQFMPSSYRHFAVDFDGDGKRDLVHSTADAIGSIANYFKEHQWREGQPIVSPASINGAKYQSLLQQGLKPQTHLGRLSGYGVTVTDNHLENTQLASLIELESAKGMEYWIGLQNFYVITRYNHSPLYAMAVYQLGQEIRAQRELSVAHRE